MWKLTIWGRSQFRDVPGRMQRKILSAIASNESFWDGLGLQLWRFFCLHPFWACSLYVGPSWELLRWSRARDRSGVHWIIMIEKISTSGLNENFSDGLGREIGAASTESSWFFSLSWLHHNVTIAMPWWSYRKGHSEVILDAFWRPCGRIFGPFWGHVELRNRLGSFLRALLRLEVDFLSSTPTILEGFGEVLGSILEVFCCLWSMLISSCILIWF